jgi:hypothetical protein
MARIGNLIRDPTELVKRAEDLDKLSTMLDRITKKDVQDTVQALKDCAEDIAYLLSGKQKPVGCPCPIVENDNYTYIDYVDKCPVHHSLKARLDDSKARCEAFEKKLKNDLRLQLVHSALGGCASANQHLHPTKVVERAFGIADAAIAALLK